MWEPQETFSKLTVYGDDVSKYASGYITHGEMQEYFLYGGDSMEPDYCLFLDWDPSNSAYVRMIAYDSAD